MQGAGWGEVKDWKLRTVATDFLLVWINKHYSMFHFNFNVKSVHLILLPFVSSNCIVLGL